MPFENNQWKPNPKQALFLSLPNVIMEAFYGGGNGSGKSEVLLAYPLIRKWYTNPRFKQVFMRRTYPELRNEIVPRSREFYQKFGAKFNKSEMSWCFPREDQYGAGTEPNGAMIYLAHCENETDVHKYDSMEINLFTPDELTSFTEYIYLYIGFTRVRTSDPNLPAIIRAAGMPGDIGHTWVKNRFVKPYPQGGKRLIHRGVQRMYVHSTVRDNPTLLKNDPTYIQKLEALPEAEKQARLFGSWDAYLGQVFEDFRDKRYPDEPENALHVIPGFDIPAWWPTIYAIDWGFAPPAMTWVGRGRISPDRRLYIDKEWCWQKTRIEDWCAQLKPIIHNDKPRVIKMCKSAGQDRGSMEHTILQQVSYALDYPVELTSSQAGSRISGKALFHEYLRWKPKYIEAKPKDYNPERAEWLLRNASLKAYKSYIEAFIPPEPELNLPKMLIFEPSEQYGGCPKLIEAIKACSYDKNNPEDVAEFPGDDPYDGCRYLVDAADRYFDESAQEYARLRKEQELLDELARTGNQTAYYRKASFAEAQTKSKFGVRRYHA